MRLSTSRVLSTDSKRGFRTPAAPTSASTAVPPRAGLGTVAPGWHPTSANDTAAHAAARICLLEMGSYPDEGQRANQERGDKNPRRPVDLALQAATGAIPAAAAPIASTDRATKARRLRCLYQHARHQQQREHCLRDGEPVLDVSHGTRRFYLVVCLGIS